MKYDLIRSSRQVKKIFTLLILSMFLISNFIAIAGSSIDFNNIRDTRDKEPLMLTADFEKPRAFGIFIANRPIIPFPFCIVFGDIDVEVRVWSDNNTVVDEVEILLDGNVVESFPYNSSTWYTWSWIKEEPRFRFYLHFLELKVYHDGNSCFSYGFPFLRFH